ncbi:MAG: hypothetical protein RR161_02915 [Bacilli bacterium]
MTTFTDPNEIKQEMQFYTYEEFKRYIENEDSLKFTCIFKTFYFCGLRKGELRRLIWKNVILEDGILIVKQNVISNHVKGVKFLLTSLKTKSSVRNVLFLNI